MRTPRCPASEERGSAPGKGPGGESRGPMGMAGAFPGVLSDQALGLSPPVSLISFARHQLRLLHAAGTPGPGPGGGTLAGSE